MVHVVGYDLRNKGLYTFRRPESLLSENCSGLKSSRSVGHSIIISKNWFTSELQGKREGPQRHRVVLPTLTYVPKVVTVHSGMSLLTDFRNTTYTHMNPTPVLLTPSLLESSFFRVPLKPGGRRRLREVFVNK